MKDTVSVTNASGLDHLLKSYEVTVSLDGVVHTSGDAIAQVGQAIRITPGNGIAYITSDIQTFKQGLGGLVTTYNFGQPGQVGLPLTLKNPGPYNTELISNGTQMITIETLLYVRAQTGGLERGAGMASADFSNTLQVSNIQFFDQNDQVIPDLRIVGSTGAVYPYNAIPEPSVLALVGAGSIGLLLARRKKA